MSKKWMPIVAGVIEIASSMFQLMVFAVLLANFMFGFVFYEHDVVGESRGWLGKSGYFLVTSVSVLMGFLAMVGGIFSLERKRFNLSLMGALAACFAVVLPLYFYASDFPRLDWPLTVLLIVSAAGIVAMIFKVPMVPIILPLFSRGIISACNALYAGIIKHPPTANIMKTKSN